MKKKDLKTGMIVKMKDGTYGIVFGNSIISTSHKGGASLERFNDDMTRGESNSWNIMQVYSEPENASGADFMWYLENFDVLLKKTKLIWERKEEKPICEIDGVEYSESTLRSLIKKATNS